MFNILYVTLPFLTFTDNTWESKEGRDVLHSQHVQYITHLALNPRVNAPISTEPFTSGLFDKATTAALCQ